MEQIGSIKSNGIREISLYLYKQGHAITFFGKAWSKVSANWIYFDTVLNIDTLINKYDKDRNLEIHENMDPRSGLERGFVDPSRGEAVIGLIYKND